MKNFLFFKKDTFPQESIEQLIQQCAEYDHRNYNFFDMDDIEADDIFACAYEDNRLVGFIYGYQVPEGTEISGLVHPAHRRQKLATTLLSEFLRSAQSDSVILTGHQDYPGLADFARVNDFSVLPRDLLMSHIPAAHNSDTDLTDFLLEYEVYDDDTFFFFIPDQDEAVGYSGVWQDASQACIHDVFVYPEFRQRGYGEKIIRTILSLFQDKKIILHVAEDNLPAVKLYQKCGFIPDNAICKYTKFIAK